VASGGFCDAEPGAGTGQLESGCRGPSKEPSLRGGACISTPLFGSDTAPAPVAILRRAVKGHSRALAHASTRPPSYRPLRDTRDDTTMHTSQIRPAVGAAVSTAAALDLRVDDAVVLHDSNRLALRLRPCDVLARVAHMAGQGVAEFEVEVARRLAETDSPVASLDPRVEPRIYVRDGFVITLWTYYEPVSRCDVPAEYAQALERLHAGMRQVDFIAPHFTDRVAEAQSLVGNRAQTPDLRDADRELLSNTLRKVTWVIGQREAAEQLLHGEPHPGNVLRTKHGLLFTDLETCCRGPVEFDVAHVPEEVSTHYPDTDQDLLCECRILMLAMVASWRWDRDDQFPSGSRMGAEFLSQIRAALERHRLGATTDLPRS